MSNKISRRTFLKCTGASAAALGTAALLGGCQSSSNASVEVKVGDKVSNWNNLGVQLTSVFTLTSAPDVPGHEYVAVLVTAVNRSSSVTFNIGAPNIAEINAAYPLDTDAAKAANTAPYFHALSASTTDFAVVCDLCHQQDAHFQPECFRCGQSLILRDEISSVLDRARPKVSQKHLQNH